MPNEICNAVKSGNVDAVKEALAKYPLDINTGNECDMTPLWMAARSGNVALVEILVNAGARIDQHANALTKSTPLSVAVVEAGEASPEKCEQYTAVVKYLLKRGADPMAPDYAGQTPLSYSKMRDHLSGIANLLVHHIEAKQTGIGQTGAKPACKTDANSSIPGTDTCKPRNNECKLCMKVTPKGRMLSAFWIKYLAEIGLRPPQTTDKDWTETIGGASSDWLLCPSCYEAAKALANKPNYKYAAREVASSSKPDMLKPEMTSEVSMAIRLLAESYCKVLNEALAKAPTVKTGFTPDTSVGGGRSFLSKIFGKKT